MRVAPCADGHLRHLDAIIQNRKANPNSNLDNPNPNPSLDFNLNPDAQSFRRGAASLPFTAIK